MNQEQTNITTGKQIRHLRTQLGMTQEELAGVMSVMTGSGPLHKDAWPFPQKLVSVILSKLADVGGPRCCKRTSRIAIEEAIRFYRQFSSVKIPLSSVLCKYFEDNKECIREDCPYYPVNK